MVRSAMRPSQIILTAMAITLAIRDTKLTEQIRKRLKLFEQHQPFIDSTWQAMPSER